MGLFGFGKKKEEPTGGDFSAYDSIEKAQQAVPQGVLAPMYLISPMFGGSEANDNVLYVPPAVIQFKDSIDNQLADALEAGKKVKGFSVNPEYKGQSVVPSKLVIKAGGDLDLDYNINIW